MNSKSTLPLCLIALLGANAAALAGAEVAAFKPEAASTAAVNVTDYTSFRLGNAATARLNALLQGWSVFNENPAPNDQNFRLRRAELKISGTVASAPKYFLMIDPARLITPPGGKHLAPDNMIQDFGVSYAVSAGLEITAGQFKIPATAEALDPSAELPLSERSLVGRTMGDRREMGVRVSCKTSLWNAASMVSSGRSLSGSGQGMFRDLGTRLELTPARNLGFGAFALLGDDFDYSKKGRWGVNGRYAAGQASFRAEFAQAKDGRVRSYGVTTEVGYRLTEDLEPVARYETFTPGQTLAVTGQAETIGLNFHLRSYLTKLQVAVSALQHMAAVNGSPTVARGANNKELTLAVQTAF